MPSWEQFRYKCYPDKCVSRSNLGCLICYTEQIRKKKIYCLFFLCRSLQQPLEVVVVMYKHHLSLQSGNAMGVKFHYDDFEYSEQGLQGNNYVHLDVSPEAAKYLLTGNKQSLRRAKSQKTTSSLYCHNQRLWCHTVTGSGKLRHCIRRR